MRAAAITAALLLSVGCAVRGPNTFRLQDRMLVPPGVKDGTVSSAYVKLPRPCRATGAPGQVKGRRMRMNRETLEHQPPGSITSWAEVCLPESNLAEQIAYSLPLPANIAFQLLYSNDRQAGWVDLTPGMRIQVVSPILRDGTPEDAPLVTGVTGSGTTLNVEMKISPNVIGFETAWYTVEKSRIVAGTVERTIGGVTEHSAKPLKNYFPESATLLRLVYKSNSTEYTQILVTGRNRAELEQNTTAMIGTPIPKRVAMNVLVPITVNGSEMLVHWGSNVGEAIRKSGADPIEALARLHVGKPYQRRTMPVEFERTNREILRLNLTGGETLSWH